MAAKSEILSHYKNELSKLLNEVNYYNQTKDYFYTDAMNNFIKRYNKLMKKYYDSTGIPLENFSLLEHEKSKSGKTVREEAINRFEITVNSTLELIEGEIEKIRKDQEGNKISPHQMRRCLKTGVNGCPKNPKLNKNKVFVGMSFEDKYIASYDYGIKIALEQLGLIPYKANDSIKNQDIMCKICNEMQKAKYLLFNISGLNPNVMLEHGLLYGLGKPVIMIKDKKTDAISDLGSLEYIEYNHAHDLMNKLLDTLEK